MTNCINDDPISKYSQRDPIQSITNSVRNQVNTKSCLVNYYSLQWVGLSNDIYGSKVSQWGNVNHFILSQTKPAHYVQMQSSIVTCTGMCDLSQSLRQGLSIPHTPNTHLVSMLIPG